MSLLKNGNFESDWSEEESHLVHVIPVGDGAEDPYLAEIGNIFTPPGWLVFHTHQEGVWSQPECRDTRATNPDRMHSGEKGYLIFSFGRKHNAGLIQQVDVEPGTKLRFSAWVHAWSNHKGDIEDFPHPDDPEWSEGAGYDSYAAKDTGPKNTGNVQEDALSNFVFAVGIDPNGGIDPLSENVVWGDRWNVYNEFHKLEVESEAQNHTVTVFIATLTRFSFKHNDAYIDDAVLEVVEEPIPENRGEPRVQYERTYVLAPPDRNLSSLASEIAPLLDLYRLTLGASADDSGIGNLDVRNVCAVDSEAWESGLESFFEQYYPGVNLYKAGGRYSENLRWAIDGSVFETPRPMNGFQVKGAVAAVLIKMMGVKLKNPVSVSEPFVTDHFGHWRGTYYHGGIDLRASYRFYGDNYVAVLGGEVVRSGFYSDEDFFGYQVRVKTILPDGSALYHRYAHMVENGQLVEVGDTVNAGDYLGKIDSTGNSTGDHCHLDLKWVGKFGEVRVDPVPIIDWDNKNDSGPMPEETYNLLGIHGIRPNNIENFISKAYSVGGNFSVVKAVDDLSYLSESDSEYHIARLTSPLEGCWGVNDPNIQLDQYARELMAPILRKIEQEPSLLRRVDYWEPMNEPLGGGVSADSYKRLALLAKECIKIANSNSISLALFSFNAGTPEWSDMKAIVETGVFEDMVDGGHVLALHEGAINSENIKLWMDGQIPGSPIVDGAGSLCFRYRFWLRLLNDIGLTVKIFITEFYAAPSPTDAETSLIVENTSWYDQEARKDPEFYGYCPFTLGPNSSWTHSDYERHYPDLIDILIHKTFVDPSDSMFIGLHDKEAIGIMGSTLAHYQLEDGPKAIEGTGKTIVRLNWGYAGVGTVPASGLAGLFVDRIINTIDNSTGVWGWIIGNEINNPTEWPNGYPNPSQIVTPDYFINIYNQVANMTGARLSPSPVDPYNVVAQQFGVTGDPKDWAEEMYEKCDRIDFITFHAKQQFVNSDPNEKFSDAPLTGRYTGVKTILDQISWIPNKYRDLQMFVTELNQQRDENNNIGWPKDDKIVKDWLKFAFDTCYVNGIDGVFVYRYVADQWALQNRQPILDFLHQEALVYR